MTWEILGSIVQLERMWRVKTNLVIGTLEAVIPPRSKSGSPSRSQEHLWSLSTWMHYWEQLRYSAEPSSSLASGITGNLSSQITLKKVLDLHEIKDAHIQCSRDSKELWGPLSEANQKKMMLFYREMWWPREEGEKTEASFQKIAKFWFCEHSIYHWQGWIIWHW